MGGLFQTSPDEIRQLWEQATSRTDSGRDDTPEPTAATPKFPIIGRLAMFAPDDDGAKGNAPSDQSQGQTKLALDWVERQFVGEKQENIAKNAMRKLTNDDLNEAQINTMYDQIIRNIKREDAEKFTSINPNRQPVVLNREQHRIVTEQLNGLRGELGGAAIQAFQKAMDAGRISIAE
jgi:hypothetical protein